MTTVNCRWAKGEKQNAHMRRKKRLEDTNVERIDKKREKKAQRLLKRTKDK